MAATKPARVNASVRCSGTWNPSDAIRIGSSRTPSSATPNGVRLIARKPTIREHRECEREVVQPHRSVEQRRRIDARDAAEAGDRRHLAEDVVADDRVGQGQHEEVDAERAARQRSEHQGDERGDDERRHNRDPRIEPERQPFGTSLGNAVADHEAGHAVREQLSQRHHPAVCGQEDHRGQRPDRG